MPRTLPVDTHAQQLIRLYEQAYHRVLLATQAAVHSGALGTEAYRRAQGQAIRTILAQLRQDTSLLAAAAVIGPYRAAARAVDVTTGAAASDAFRFSGVHTQAVQAGALALHNQLTGAVRTVGREVDDVFRQVGVEQSTLGLAAGEARREVSQAMEADLRSRGITAFVDRAGRRWTLPNYSRMVVRTTTREMVTVGTNNRMRDHGQQLITVSDHGTTCAICAEFEGNTYSITGLPVTVGGEVYDPAPDHAPYHPNCWHVETPADVTFEAFERALLNPVVSEDDAQVAAGLLVA